MEMFLHRTNKLLNTNEMNCVTEERLNSMQSDNTLVQDIKKEMIKNNGRLKLNNDESKSSISEIFPWILEFRKMCRCIYTEKSMASLTELMQFYVRNVCVSANECYTRPLRAAKLKECISETLLLFLYIYRELSEDCDRSIYLNNMSDLLALYIDMELKASKKSKEDHEKICARLTSCLYVYLEHSIEHLLDTLIKIQFMCRNYHHILDPVITKIMKNVPMHPESSTMYIRYFFIYRLWRKINENSAVKNHITTTAVASLGPLPSAFSPSILEDVLPKVPKSLPNYTKALLQHKFDIKKHCEIFVQYHRETIGSVHRTDGPATTINSSTRIDSKMREDNVKDANHLDSIMNSNISDKSNQNESISLVKAFKSRNFEEQSSFKCLGTFSNNIFTENVGRKSIKSNLSNSRGKCKKSNEIVFIDLTSDTVFEKCIKKRKVRNLPWLEEAKKRFGMKIAKTSRKIKMTKREQRDGRAHQSSTSRSINHQLEDSSQTEHATEYISEKNESNTFRTIATEQAENKMEIDKKEAMVGTENVNRSIDAEVNIKEVNVNSSTVTGKLVLTKIQPLTKQVSNATDKTVNDTCLRNGDISNMQCDGKENDRFNKQTVIKRLIKTNIFSEPEAREKVESFKNVCDQNAERPDVNSTTTCARYGFKDNVAKSDRSHASTTNEVVTEQITLSEINGTVLEQNRNISSDRLSRNDRFDKSVYRSDFCGKIINSQVNGVNETATQTSDKIETNFKDAAKINDERAPAADVLNYAIELPASRVLVDRSVLQKSFESRAEVQEKPPECAANAVVNAKQNGFCERAKLEICNYEEVDANLSKNAENVANTRESIFESYSMDKKNISDTVKATYPGKNAGNKNSCVDTSSNSATRDITSEQRTVNKHVDVENDRSKCGAASLTSAKITSKVEGDNLCCATREKDTRNVVESKFIVQDAELQDNIDGLSLLASVSQHVPHLKPESEVKSEQIKVKDYASLRYTCYSQMTDDEADTNDSSNTVSQLLENPSTEIINRIVGIYPEDGLDKVAVRVQVTSNEADNLSKSCELSDAVSSADISCANYDTDTLAQNLVVPVESNVQTVKENTNVILNGETVVLLQKSPNSNLYIINKAVENAKDHNNDEETSRLKEKNWEECGQFEAVTSLDHVSCSLELTPHTKELPYSESKYSVVRAKGIKLEPADNNFSEAKMYAKKVLLAADMYQDAGVIDKRKTSKSGLPYRSNIKQEFNNIPNHMPANCSIPGCNGIHTNPHEVDAQHPLHITPTHPNSLPSIYGNCAGNTDLCVPYHKHCSSVSCSLQINATTSLHPHAKAGSPCGRSHCSCLNCTYDIVTHCRQCIHPAGDGHVPCIESSPYFLPTHSSVQSPAVQEHDRGKSEAIIGKLYDDQLLCKIEKSLLQTNSLEKLDAQRDPEKMYNKDVENKLPLKKRLKAHAMAAYREMPIKVEKVDNYPAVPMMSIAALEPLEGAQNGSVQIVKSEYDLSLAKKNESRDSGYRCSSNLVRRDYYKDVYVAGPPHYRNHAKEGTRKVVEREFRPINDQPSSAICQESSCLQRTVQTAAQRKEIDMSEATRLKRYEMEPLEREGTYKKVKKTLSPPRQTRSSKRNVPKVNYSYTDVDPEWSPSGESKRKRRKSSR